MFVLQHRSPVVVATMMFISKIIALSNVIESNADDKNTIHVKVHPDACMHDDLISGRYSFKDSKTISISNSEEIRAIGNFVRSIKRFKIIESFHWLSDFFHTCGNPIGSKKSAILFRDLLKHRDLVFENLCATPIFKKTYDVFIEIFETSQEHGLLTWNFE